MKSIFGTAVVGIIALALVIYEWDFGRRALASEGVVLASGAYGRSGVTIADVLHPRDRRHVGGQQVRATLRAWYRHLNVGQKVRVLYLPGDPGNVWLDAFWQRHCGSAVALALFAILGTSEVLRVL